MTIELSKRALVRIITFMTALVLVAGILFAKSQVENEEFKRSQEYTYLQSVEDLYTYLSNINSSLTKGVYCSTPEMLGTLSSMLWRDAGFAKKSLALLPVDYFELENTNKFISQVGDYAVFLSKKVTSGEAVNADEAATLQKMKGYCEELMGSIYVLQELVRQGQINYSRVSDEVSHYSGDQNFASFGDGFKDFEESLGEFPSLIYDGPFSDHILQKEPALLKNEVAVTREQARKTASKASGLPESELKDAGDEEGKMPSYCFSNSDNTIDIGVTKAGGYITYYTSSRSVNEQKLSAEQAIEKAKEYLSSFEVTSVESSYYEISNNILTANFAYQKDGVTYYTDLIKVAVALDDGGIISLHQRGYISNHTERNLPTPVVTQQQAERKLSPLLTVQECKLAVIPSEGLSEIFCYEFSCKGQNDEDILVYINVETAAEEQLLILIIGENGVLTV